MNSHSELLNQSFWIRTSELEEEEECSTKKSEIKIEQQNQSCGLPDPDRRPSDDNWPFSRRTWTWSVNDSHRALPRRTLAEWSDRAFWLCVGDVLCTKTIIPLIRAARFQTAAWRGVWVWRYVADWAVQTELYELSAGLDSGLLEFFLWIRPECCRWRRFALR